MESWKRAGLPIRKNEMTTPSDLHAAMQRGDAASLKNGSRSTIRNLSSEDDLTFVCITIPDDQGVLDR